MEKEDTCFHPVYSIFFSAVEAKWKLQQQPPLS